MAIYFDLSQGRIRTLLTVGFIDFPVGKLNIRSAYIERLRKRKETFFEERDSEAVQLVDQYWQQLVQS